MSLVTSFLHKCRLFLVFYAIQCYHITHEDFHRLDYQPSPHDPGHDQSLHILRHILQICKTTNGTTTECTAIIMFLSQEVCRYAWSVSVHVWWMYVCVYMFVCVCVCACVRACVHVCVCALVCMFVLHAILILTVIQCRVLLKLI